MPIEVHCPNPVCARVHLVKNRYAGMRGKCPACNYWMYVPQQGAMPSMAAPRPDELEELAQRKKASKPIDQPFDDAEEKSSLLEDAIPPAKKPAAKAKAKAKPVAEEPVLATLDDDEDAPAKPKRRFSWLAALLVFLGTLSLGAVAAAPYLPAPSEESAGDPSKNISATKQRGISPQHVFFIQIAPACVAAGALLTLLTAMITRQFAFPSVFLLYLTTVGTAIIGLLLLNIYRDDMSNLDKEIQALELRAKGPVKFDKGLQLYALGGGTVGAAAMFTLAIVVVHRRLWSKFLGLLFAVALFGLVGVYVFRKYLPADLQGYFPEEHKLLEMLSSPFN